MSWRELENLRLAVLGGGGSLRRSVNALLLEGGPKLVAEGTSHAQILELVRNGKRMVGIVPGLISNPALERLGLKAVRLSELAGEVGELAIFWKRDREQEPGISELLRALKGR